MLALLQQPGLLEEKRGEEEEAIGSFQIRGRATLQIDNFVSRKKGEEKGQRPFHMPPPP